MKKFFGHKCQLFKGSFPIDNGNYYCEAHHIKELSKLEPKNLRYTLKMNMIMTKIRPDYIKKNFYALFSA